MKKTTKQTSNGTTTPARLEAARKRATALGCWIQKRPTKAKHQFTGKTRPRMVELKAVKLTKQLNPTNLTQEQFKSVLPSIVPPLRDNMDIYNEVSNTIHGALVNIESQTEKLTGDLYELFYEFADQYKKQPQAALTAMLTIIGDTQTNRQRIFQYLILQEMADILGDLELSVPVVWNDKLIEEMRQKIAANN